MGKINRILFFLVWGDARLIILFKQKEFSFYKSGGPGGAAPWSQKKKHASKALPQPPSERVNGAMLLLCMHALFFLLTLKTSRHCQYFSLSPSFTSTSSFNLFGRLSRNSWSVLLFSLSPSPPHFTEHPTSPHIISPTPPSCTQHPTSHHTTSPHLT